MRGQLDVLTVPAANGVKLACGLAQLLNSGAYTNGGLCTFVSHTQL